MATRRRCRHGDGVRHGGSACAADKSFQTFGGSGIRGAILRWAHSAESESVDVLPIVRRLVYDDDTIVVPVERGWSGWGNLLNLIKRHLKLRKRDKILRTKQSEYRLKSFRL